MTKNNFLDNCFRRWDIDVAKPGQSCDKTRSKLCQNCVRTNTGFYPFCRFQVEIKDSIPKNTGMAQFCIMSTEGK
jgi:hypothetical protein